jgi:hypothetical protein
MRWIFVCLVVINVVFFAVMQWGAPLLVDPSGQSASVEINADKVKIMSPSAGVVASAVPVVTTQLTQSAVAVATSVKQVQPLVKQTCVEWGEFSGVDLQRAEKALAVIKLSEKPKRRLVDSVSGYWVYIAPLKTRAQAEQKITQLKERGVADFFVIQEAGVWQNAISLGVFKTEEAAKNYLAKLQQQGVRSATVGERAGKLKHTVFLLNHLDTVSSSQITALQKNFPESELKSVACN